MQIPVGFKAGMTWTVEVPKPNAVEVPLQAIPESPSRPSVARSVASNSQSAVNSAVSALMVTVPAGCMPGETFIVDNCGAEFQVRVPQGYGPGMQLEVEPPSRFGSSAGSVVESRVESSAAQTLGPAMVYEVAMPSRLGSLGGSNTGSRVTLVVEESSPKKPRAPKAVSRVGSYVGSEGGSHVSRYAQSVIEVAVPHGCKPGDCITVEDGDFEFEVQIPEGYLPGMLMDVMPPERVASLAGSQVGSIGGQSVLEVTVPEGYLPGDFFTVEDGDREFDVQVPEGYSSGMRLEVIAPSRFGSVAPSRKGSQAASKLGSQVGSVAESTLEVTVPKGFDAGDYFTVESNGEQFEIQVPAGCRGGMRMTYVLPASSSDHKAQKVDIGAPASIAGWGMPSAAASEVAVSEAPAPFAGEVAPLQGKRSLSSGAQELKASPQGLRLRVSVLSASGLQNAAWVGKSELYVTCRLPPDEEPVFKTNVVQDSLLPVWDFTSELQYQPGQSLEFAIWDDDGSALAQLEPLGLLTLSSLEFLPGGLDAVERSFDQGSACKGARLCVRVEVVRPAPVGSAGSVGSAASFAAYEEAAPSLAGAVPAFQAAVGSACSLNEDEFPELAPLKARPPGTDPAFKVPPAVSLRPKQSREVQVLFALRVTVVSAKGLRDADWMGKSDPFCTCRIWTKEKPEFQTPVVKDDLSPVWNHESVIAEYSPGEPLELTVFDHDDSGSHTKLGSVQLASAQFFPDGLHEEVKLAGGGKGLLMVKLENLGTAAEYAVVKASAAAAQAEFEAAQAALRAAGPNRLRVTVLSATGLRTSDWTGKSDPFAICRILTKAQPEFQTLVITDSLNPVWNCTYDIVEFMPGDPLELVIYDDDVVGKDVLGRVQLESHKFFPAGLDEEVVLTGKGAKGTLRIKIEDLGAVAYFAAAQAALTAAGPNRLRVTLIGATGLRNSDLTSKSDPFATCRIATKDEPEFQTGVVKDNVNPVWNYTYDIAEFMPGDPLELTVSDLDDLGNDVLGRVQLESHKFFPAGLDEELVLTGKGAKGTLGVKIYDLGSVADFAAAQAALRATGPNRLRVTVMSATGLRNSEWTSKSDPFVTCRIVTRDEPEFQTYVVKDNLNPVWNYAFEVVEFMPGDPLELVVYDHDDGVKDLLGRVQLESCKFFPAGLDEELVLTGKAAQGVLRVKIEDLGTSAAVAAAHAALRAVGPSRLRITLFGATGLKDCGKTTKTDPFASCRIATKDEPEFQTPVLRGCLDPAWNHAYEIAEHLVHQWSCFRF
ncbi:unnamed protein product [Polarella glacialis]|uniref:C2 domain-containing protein n=1 Tax=Polarella glacialis TaxID=89957 RepID=A0A813E4J9_POLGL|nr:unnamed protein product [Polarella glacialis]